MEPLAHATFDWLTTGLWRSLCLGLPLLLAERLLAARLPVQLRSLLLLTALAAIVIPPLRWIPSADMDALLTPPVALATAVDWRTPLLGLWLIGALVSLTIHCWRRQHMSHWLDRHSRPAPAKLNDHYRALAEGNGNRRCPELRIGGAAVPACIHGLLRPRIVIPEALLDQRHLLDHTLRHELTHARRGDPLWQALVTLARCVLWFNPVIHLLARYLHRLRELGCDAAVSRRLGNATPDYFKAMLQLAAKRHLHRGAVYGLAHGLMESESLVLQRLRALEDGSSRRVPRWYLVTAALLLAVVVLSVGQNMRYGALARDRDLAAEQLNAMAADGPGIGSMHVKFAAQRLAAAEQQLKETD